MSFYIAKLGVFLALISTLVNCQLIDLKDGNVGVNFGGYHASAGLGGLLTGDLAKGGLHAEAGTPHGQAAGAGLGGHVDNDGTSSGGLYAGATAGGGVSADAGLGGRVTKTGSIGYAGSGASAGGLGVGSGGSGGDVTFVKTVHTVPVAPTVHIEKQFYAGPILPKKTIYVEKSIPIVPITQQTIVQQQPETFYIRKNYRRPHHHRKHAYYNVYAGTNLGYQEAAPHTVKVVEKSYSAPAPVVVQKYVAPAPVVVQKYVAPARGGFLTQLFANYQANTNTNGGVNGEAGKDGTATYAANASFNKSNLFNDIFNIPISTLTAVNQLVNNIVGGTSVSVSKTITGSANVNANAHAQAQGEAHHN